VNGHLGLIKSRGHLRDRTRLPVEPCTIPKYLQDSTVKQFCSPNDEFGNCIFTRCAPHMLDYIDDEVNVPSLSLEPPDDH
jgi:hypothetical protein